MVPRANHWADIRQLAARSTLRQQARLSRRCDVSRVRCFVGMPVFAGVGAGIGQLIGPTAACPNTSISTTTNALIRRWTISRPHRCTGRARPVHLW